VNPAAGDSAEGAEDMALRSSARQSAVARLINAPPRCAGVLPVLVGGAERFPGFIRRGGTRSVTGRSRVELPAQAVEQLERLLGAERIGIDRTQCIDGRMHRVLRRRSRGEKIALPPCGESVLFQ